LWLVFFTMKIVSGPVLCNYYVTYRCNAACGFCDIWQRPSPYVTLSEAIENFTALKKLGVRVIDFTGGEPLLHQEIDQLLHLAKSQGFITTLTTNTLLYPKKAEKLKGLVDMLHFSLDSPCKEQHDASRGVACFDFLLESIEVAKRLGERPDILFTVFSHNISDIQEVYDEFVVKHKLMLLLNPVFDYNQVETGQQFTVQELEQLRKWGKIPHVYLNDAFIDLRLEGGNQIANPVCKAASTTLVISPENKLVLPCYHLGIKDIPIKGQLEALWKGQAVQQLIALEGRLPACQGCTINCYMQPSFATEMNRFWWKALPSTLKYNLEKGTWKKLLKNSFA